MIAPGAASLLEARAVLRDFRRYARGLLKVKHRDTFRLSPLRFKPIQAHVVDAIERAEAEDRPARIIVLKARRLGVSTAVASKFSHVVFTQKLQRGNVVAHRGDSVETIFGLYERFWANLPPVCQPRRAGGTGRRLAFPDLDSELQVGVAGRQIEFGRGGDCQLLHLTEVPYYDDPEAFLMACKLQVPAVPRTIIVLEGTARRPGDFWHGLWTKSKDGVSGWEPLFGSWLSDPDYRMAPALDLETVTDEEERALIARFGVDGLQLRWRRFMLETECFGRADYFRREFPATEQDAWVSVGTPAWDASTVLACLQHQEPLFRGTLTDKGIHRDPAGDLIVWEEPLAGAEYVIGVDVAAGLATGNLGAAEVFRVGKKPGQWPIQVAEWAGRQDAVTFAQTLTLLGHYYQKALLAVEVTGIGRPVQNALQKVYFYPRLHRWIQWDQYKARSDVYGWETNWKSKPAMLGIMDWLLRTKHVTLKSPWASQEFVNYHQVSPDDYEGLSGDDRVMAVMIAMASWFQHLFASVALKDLRGTLAKLYGAPTDSEGATAPPAWTPDSESPPPKRWQPRNAVAVEGDW